MLTLVNENPMPDLSSPADFFFFGDHAVLDAQPPLPKKGQLPPYEMGTKTSRLSLTLTVPLSLPGPLLPEAVLRVFWVCFTRLTSLWKGRPPFRAPRGKSRFNEHLNRQAPPLVLFFQSSKGVVSLYLEPPIFVLLKNGTFPPFFPSHGSYPSG